MTKQEFENQSKRIEKYKDAMDRIAVIENKIIQVQNGILVIECDYTRFDFEYLGKGFKKRLAENVVQFLNSEIENLKKIIEEI
ncbi:MAG: hypothetical protein ACLRZ9_05735 [Eubacterium sp.]